MVLLVSKKSKASLAIAFSSWSESALGEATACERDSYGIDAAALPSVPLAFGGLPCPTTSVLRSFLKLG